MIDNILKFPKEDDNEAFTNRHKLKVKQPDRVAEIIEMTQRIKYYVDEIKKSIPDRPSFYLKAVPEDDYKAYMDWKQWTRR